MEKIVCRTVHCESGDLWSAGDLDTTLRVYCICACKALGVPALVGCLCLVGHTGPPKQRWQAHTKAVEPEGERRTSWRSLCCAPGCQVMCRRSYQRANRKTVSWWKKKKGESAKDWQTLSNWGAVSLGGGPPLPYPPSWAKCWHGSLVLSHQCPFHLPTLFVFFKPIT